MLNEHSHKWPAAACAVLLRDTAFSRGQHRTDDAGWFGASLASG